MPSCSTSPAVAAAGLLGAELLVAGAVEHQVERPLVVADVVGGAGDGGAREGVGGDEVDAPHLGGVEADLGGEEVHGPLDGRGGLGTAGTAVGDGGRRVGGDGAAVHLDLGDVVGARAPSSG